MTEEVRPQRTEKARRVRRRKADRRMAAELRTRGWDVREPQDDINDEGLQEMSESPAALQCPPV